MLRVVQARAGERSAGGAHEDLGIAQCRSAQHGVDGGHERCVAAVVLDEGAAGVGLGGGAQVGVDVAAAEPVDGLLGVADEHHRGVAEEGPLQDLPLHRIGVLELVDEHEPPAVAHDGAGG